MNFEGEIDPEIAARHKAVFDDLANEIDALDSDGEDDGYQPQPKAQQKTAPKSGASNKMYKVETDDDMGFPKFDNAAFKELEQGLKMKNNFDDLEKEIMDMDSDDDGPSMQNKPRQTLTKEPTNFTKPATNNIAKQSQEGSNPSINTRSQANSVNQHPANASKGTSKASTVSFPFNHFTGLDPKKLIEIDNKLHGKDCLMTLGLVNYEIEEIIDPCLSSANVDEEIKKHLEIKKKSLLVFKNNISNLFKKGDLNAAKYIQLIAKMKTTNIKVAQDLQKANASKETERVKERLRILMDEEKEYLGMAQGAPTKTSAPTSNKSSETRKKEPNLVDSLKPVAETRINKILPSEIDSLSNEQLRELLKKRKDQYWNLATYMSKEILKHLEGNDLAQKKQFIQNSLIPLIQKASKYLENFDTGDSGEIADFLKDTLVEVTPALLHGKSLQERSADLQKIIELIETCTKEETDYTEKQRATLDDATGPGGKKVKEGEKAIEKNGEYIEYLSKLSSDKFMWVPSPKVTIGIEQRTISLVNKDVDAKSMLVRFKGLENLTHRKYWMRWTIEGAQGQMHFTTHHCDEHSLQFNYQQLVPMTTKEKLDSSIENKQIHIEVLYKQMFVEKKKAEGVIPLTGLRKSNHIEGKVKLRSDGIELNYVLRVREPLLKHIKIDVSTVHSFQTFEAFDKNAPFVQAPPPEKKPAKPQEESKIQEPAAAAGGGGKLFEKKKYPPLVLLPQANDPLASLNEKELPPGITLELAKDPSNPDLIDCLSVLKLLAEELEKARTGLAVEGRRNDNKVVSDNWTKALRKATILEAKFGSGDIDPGQYLEMLKAGLDRDQKLIQLYKAKGDNDRLAFTLEKMNHTKKEQKELEDALAAEGEEGS